MIEPGDHAPDFELPDQLSDFRGQPVVVYFYPKAATPGTKATNTALGLPHSAATILA